MNSILNLCNTSFKGNLIFIDKKGNKTLVPATEVKNIEEKVSGLGKGVYITTDIDKSWGNTYYYWKNIPYNTIVENYKKAINSNEDVEINVE